LNKRFREERIVSRIKLNVKILYFLLLLFSSSQAQIPINGFCRYREFSVKPGLTKIFPVDFTNDGYRDLILFTGTDSRYVTLASDYKSNLVGPSEKNTAIDITQIHAFGNEINGRRYLIISRRNRQAELASFSKSGSVNPSSKVKLQGFPANIDIGDIHGNGKATGLASGPSLNGLHIIEENKRVLVDKRVVDGRIFTASAFIDLDYDGYSDIVAFDPTTNTMILYDNNHSGGFSESRSFRFDNAISELKAIDFNSDNFTDLVFLENGKIQILVGDSVSSFRKRITFETPVSVSKYVVFDFNGDGYNDIAYLNNERKELYISFAKNTKEFYPPILYMKKENLTDLSAYVDRAGRKLAVLSSNGKVFIINSFRLDDDLFSIGVGLKPTVIQLFDYLNDSFKDICFFDETDSSLKFFLNERRNLFRTYLSFPVTSECTDIKVDDSRAKIKTFFLINKDSRMLEIIRIDFENFSHQNLVVYLDGTIDDLKFVSDRLTDRETISALIRKNNTLAIQTFDLRNFKAYMNASEDIAANVMAASLSHEVYKNVYYFAGSKDGIVLTKSTFDKKVVDRNSLLTLNESHDEDTHCSLFSMDQIVDRYKPTIAMVSTRNNTSLYLLYKNKINKFLVKANASFTPMIQSSYDDENNSLLIGFKDELGKLHYINLELSTKSINETILINSAKFNNYLLQNWGGKRKYLIYSDKDQNTLTFEKFR
jgi:hypothetical protein